jgi:ribose/xylose/arabinose/galactoside ABC-type transport system permease subunit
MKKDSNKFKSLFHHKVFTLVCLWLAMVIIFSIWAAIRHTSFLQLSIFKNILNAMVVPGFLTIGAGFLLIAGHLDLSQAAIGAFGSMVLATAISAWNLPWYLAIILCLVLCVALGVVNGLMVVKLHFPSFIGTLAMASMVKGLMYLFSSLGNNGTAANINFVDPVTAFIGSGTIAGIPFCVILVIIAFIVFGVILSKTSFGMKITFLGGNPTAATLAGINAASLTILLFAFSGLSGGVGGIISSARLSQGNLMALNTSQFVGLTAAILGGISFGGGVGGMGGAFVGLLILNTFQIGMGIVGINPFWVNVFSGVLLLVALSLDFFSMRRQQKALA